MIDNAFKYTDLMDLFESSSKEVKSNKFEHFATRHIQYAQFEAMVRCDMMGDCVCACVCHIQYAQFEVRAVRGHGESGG